MASTTPCKSCSQGLSPSQSWSPGHILTVWCLSYIEASKTAHSTQGDAAPMQCRGGQLPPLTGWLCCAWGTPGHTWIFCLSTFSCFLFLCFSILSLLMVKDRQKGGEKYKIFCAILRNITWCYSFLGLLNSHFYSYYLFHSITESKKNWGRKGPLTII